MLTPDEKQYIREQIKFRQNQESPGNKTGPWSMELQYRAIQIKYQSDRLTSLGKDTDFLFNYALRQLRENGVTRMVNPFSDLIS